MFVLERNKGNIKTETIQEETQVQVKPISGKHLKKFQLNFEKVDMIKEVYQYAMVRNNESILVVGYVLNKYSDNSRTSCIHTKFYGRRNFRITFRNVYVGR